MAYTTRSKIEQYLSADLSAIDSLVTEWISAAKLIIDKYTGKTFEVAAETRYYDGNGSDRIFIDSFYGVPTTVALLNYDGSVDTTLVEGADQDYVAYPLNTIEKNELVLMPNARRQFFSRAFDNILDDENPQADQNIKRLIKVTANFGTSATVPADVALAATMIVAKVAEKGLKGGTPASESLGDYSISFKSEAVATNPSDLSPEITALLDPYRDVEV